KFYSETLGLEVIEDTVMEMPMLTLRLATGGEIMIYGKENHTPASYTMLNFPVENLEETVDALAKRGVHFESYDMGDIKTDEKGIARSVGTPDKAWFTDPGGNIIQVLSTRVREA